MPCDYRQKANSRPHDVTKTLSTGLKDPARPHPADARRTNQPLAEHNLPNNSSGGYKEHQRPVPANTHRKRSHLPPAFNSSTNNQAPPDRLGTHLTPKTARATTPKPNGDPSDRREAATLHPIGQPSHRRSPPQHAPPPQPKRRRTTSTRDTPRQPYISHAAVSDEEGEPWCDCCTAHLSDSDPTPGLIDPSTPDIRYRIRRDTDQPPTHSNQHRDYTDIFRDNADFNARQRHTWERAEARNGGQLPTLNLYTSTYMNTPAVSDLSSTIANRQFERYQRRGGRLIRGAHTTDHRFNSPNKHNMTPGNPYRTWFHRTISRNHYSLGEATSYLNQWLNDPAHGPDRNRDHNQNPYLPHARHHSSPTVQPPPNRPEPESPEHSVHSTSTASLSHSQQTPENRSQTIVEDVHLSPDDPNAVIDSGAMMTTTPRRLLMGTIWQDNIRPAPPGTSIRYGNMETEPVEEMATIGSYQASIVPDRFSTALVCVHDIVAAGHNVTFTNSETIVHDIGSAYTLRTPRNPVSREWRVPLHILQRLTDLRAAHPLHHLQSQPTPNHPN